MDLIQFKQIKTPTSARIIRTFNQSASLFLRQWGKIMKF